MTPQDLAEQVAETVALAQSRITGIGAATGRQRLEDMPLFWRGLIAASPSSDGRHDVADKQFHLVVEVVAMGADEDAVRTEISAALGRVHSVVHHEVASTEVRSQHDIDDLIRGCYGHCFPSVLE